MYEVLEFKRRQLNRVENLIVEYDKTQYSPDDLANPSNQFKYFQRFLKKLKNIENELKYESELELDLSEYSLPNEADIEGTIDGILRVQDTYLIETNNFITGQFEPVKNSNYS